MQKQPYCVYLDTEVFINIKCDFENSSLKRLIELKNKGVLKLIITDITYQEIRRHMNKMVENFTEENNKINKIAGNALSKIINHYRVNSIVVEELEKKLKIDFFQTLDTFVNDIDKIDCYCIDPKVVFDSYFNSKAPFENKKDKKHEFPDAFLFEALVKYQEINNLMLILVTADDGLRLACANKPNFKHCQKIEEAINFIYSEIEAKEYAAIKNYLYNNTQKILDVIKDRLDTDSITVKIKTFMSYSSLISYEILHVDIKSIEILSFNIVKITPKRCLLETSLNLSLDVELELITDIWCNTFTDTLIVPKETYINFDVILTLNDGNQSNIKLRKISKPKIPIKLSFEKAELYKLFHAKTREIFLK